MAPNPWEARLKDFLKKAGDDFKRAGTEVKSEAQRLMAEVNDEETRQKVRARLKEVGDWAKKTGDELTGLVDKGLVKAETVIEKASEKVKDFAIAPTQPRPEPPAPVPSVSAAAPAPKPAPPPEPLGPPKKTVGRAKSAGKSSRAKTGPRKSVGRKKPAAKG